MISGIKRLTTNRRVRYSKICQMSFLLFLAAIVYCFFTVYYADITVTGRFGLVFLDSIFDGVPRSFYSNALASGIAPEGAVYDIGTYVIFAVWSIPVWILQHVIHLDPMCAGSLLWFKLLVVIFYVGTIYWFYKVAALLQSEDDAAMATLIYTTSLYTFFPVFIAVQYDVLSVFFLLAGIYYCLENSRRWLIFMAISITIKPMSLLILVLVILWKEKNILQILIQLIEGLSLLLLCKLIYFRDPGYAQSASGFLSKNLSGLLNNGIATPYGLISVFVLVISAIYLVAYFTSDTNPRQMILLAFGIWGAFEIFGGMTCYWSIYLAPFMTLAVFVGGRTNRGKLLLIQYIQEVLMLIVFILHTSWVYGGSKTYSYLLLKPIYQKGIGNGDDIATAAGLLRRLGMEPMIPAILAVALICLAGIGYVGYRNMQQEDSLPVAHKENHDRNVVAITFVRAVTVWIFLAYTAAALFVAAR